MTKYIVAMRRQRNLMNKREINKLQLFFGGLKSRYEDSKDFFVELDFEYVSGNKKFKGSYDEKLYYNKEWRDLSFDKALDFVLGEASKYDALVLTYKERGANVVIRGDQRDVSIKQEAQENLPKNQQETKRNYYIKTSQAQDLLQEIGILTKDGKIKNDKIRKYNQIDHFIEVVDPILRALPEDKEINVLDAACGKSYLTFVLNYYIKEVMKRKCYFVGVDYNEGVIQASQERAKRLGYKNMEFIQADLSQFEPERPMDLMVSLHACDNATDYAIATGIRLDIPGMIVVPCCHKEFIDKLQNQELEPIFRHSIFKVRFNDMFTDALRSLYLESHGYEVSALEFISPLDSPKNLMIRAMKKSKDNPSAKEEYKKIKKMFGIDPIIEKL